jgi:L,D-peptidoglycan transpeptidase YkuD (ErfK/YbiS/YcfS/YnhG family)
VRKLAAAVVVLAVLAPTPARAATRDITLGGVVVTLHAHTRQVVTVNRTRGYHAHIGFWIEKGDRWQRVYDVRDGRIGYGGLAAPRHRVQGSGTTPLGTVRLISTFGREPQDPSWGLPYRRIHRGDYWVEDNGSRFYNRYRNKAQGGFRWWLPSGNANSSERLLDFKAQYDLSIVTSYNHGQVRHRGAGIFLHVNGKGATAGCVSGPRLFLRRMMWRLDPSKAPVMAVGR